MLVLVLVVLFIIITDSRGTSLTKSDEYHENEHVEAGCHPTPAFDEIGIKDHRAREHVRWSGGLVPENYRTD